MLISGAQIVVAALEKEGVDVLFGYPGGQALPLYDALYDCAIKHILTRHEQGAVHAAEGYSRATGKVGVCISTSGPGATNLVTGIADANMDSTPLVCITCQVGMNLLGKDSFQEADISGITTPITKHNFMVRETADLPNILSRAFYIARSGRPGPVVVDIPRNILQDKVECPAYPENISLRAYKPLFAGNETAVDSVARAIAKSARPLFFIGGGVVGSGTSATMRQIIDKTAIPFVCSLMGLSAMPTTHPQHLGMVGMHGSYAANMAVSNCDLLIGCGVRFDDRVTSAVEHFAPNAKIVHFDVDLSEINKLVKTDYRVAGDLRWSLPLLCEKLSPADYSKWQKEITAWKQEYSPSYDRESPLIKPQQVIEEVNKIKAVNAVIVTDVGQHQMWAAQYADLSEPRTFITSGGLGTMGYGLPAASGAQIALPDREVWLFSGDGSFMMNCQEMATAVEHELPVKIIVLNNYGLGMVRQWQRSFYDNRCSNSRHNTPTDLAKLAEAFGARGINVTEKEQLIPALLEAKNCRGPVLVNVSVDEMENVLPMVAPNAPLNKMLR